MLRVVHAMQTVDCCRPVVAAWHAQPIECSTLPPSCVWPAKTCWNLAHLTASWQSRRLLRLARAYTLDVPMPGIVRKSRLSPTIDIVIVGTDIAAGIVQTQ